MDNMPKVTINTEWFIGFAFAILILPFRWVCAWITASAFHELCHYIALKICGCGVSRVQIGLNGTVMETDLCSNRKELICALSGPFGGLMLILIAKYCPRIAICGLFQSAYNLIPIYPLDGGRVVRSTLHIFFSCEISRKIQIYLENSILIIFVLLAIYVAFALRLGLMPLIFAGILIMKNKKGKYTCKERL